MSKRHFETDPADPLATDSKDRSCKLSGMETNTTINKDGSIGMTLEQIEAHNTKEGQKPKKFHNPLVPRICHFCRGALTLKTNGEGFSCRSRICRQNRKPAKNLPKSGIEQLEQILA